MLGSFLTNHERGGFVLLAVLAAGCILVPVCNLLVPETWPIHIPTFTVTLLGKYLCFALLAVALDLVWGYVGILSLGHAAFFALGDYASGTNHTLPTGGFAKSYSGVSLDSFVKKITFQHITPEGLKNIGDTVEIMAAAEGLQAHKNAVSIRLKTL
jgi:ABC-type branched-subunit amino acid transport system permease subunit